MRTIGARTTPFALARCRAPRTTGHLAPNCQFHQRTVFFFRSLVVKKCLSLQDGKPCQPAFSKGMCPVSRSGHRAVRLRRSTGGCKCQVEEGRATEKGSRSHRPIRRRNRPARRRTRRHVASFEAAGKRSQYQDSLCEQHHAWDRSDGARPTRVAGLCECVICIVAQFYFATFAKNGGCARCPNGKKPPCPRTRVPRTTVAWCCFTKA